MELPVVLPDRQAVRVVRPNPAHPGTDGENHLDHLVQRRLVAGRTGCAVIVFLADRLQGRRGIQHAAATGAQHVPGHVEQTDPRGLEQHGDRGLLPQTELSGEFQRVDVA